MKNITVFFLAVTLFGSLVFSQRNPTNKGNASFERVDTFHVNLLDNEQDLARLFILPLYMVQDLSEPVADTSFIDLQTLYVCGEFFRRGSVRLYNFQVGNDSFETAITNGPDSLVLGAVLEIVTEQKATSVMNYSLYRKVNGSLPYAKVAEIQYRINVETNATQVLITTRKHKNKADQCPWLVSKNGGLEIIVVIMALVSEYEKSMDE